MTTKTFKTSELKKEIKAKFGGIRELKSHLKQIAVDQYDCFHSEVTVYGCRIYYTTNPNHFCKFGISIPLVGMSSSKALGKSSLTKAGLMRCPNSYINL